MFECRVMRVHRPSRIFLILLFDCSPRVPRALPRRPVACLVWPGQVSEAEQELAAHQDHDAAVQLVRGILAKPAIQLADKLRLVRRPVPPPQIARPRAQKKRKITWRM